MPPTYVDNPVCPKIEWVTVGRRLVPEVGQNHMPTITNLQEVLYIRFPHFKWGLMMS